MKENGEVGNDAKIKNDDAVPDLRYFTNLRYVALLNLCI